MNVEQMVTAVTRMASVQTHMEVTAVNVPVDTVAMVEHAQVHSVKLLMKLLMWTTQDPKWVPVSTCFSKTTLWESEFP